MMLPQLLVLLAAISGTALLLGGGGWLWYRIRRLEERGTGPGGGRREVATEIEQLEEELASNRRQTRALAERVDFLERLLEAGDGPDGARGRPTGDPANDPD